MIDYVLSGFIAGFILGIVLGIYVLVRKDKLVMFFKDQDESIARMSDRALFVIILGCFISAALMFGVLAGLVYAWLGVTSIYVMVSIGAAVLLSLLAVVSRTPLVGDKIFWNFAVGGVLGFMVPLLAGI
jgi:uncharacterized membrane protein